MCHPSFLVSLGSLECITGRTIGFVKAFDAQRDEDNYDVLHLFKIRPSDHQGGDTVTCG